MKQTILFILCALTLSACYTERKATKQVGKAAAVYPGVLSRICALTFPVKSSSTTLKEYVQGETVYDTDTVWRDCPSRDGDTVVIRVPCPPQKTRVDTFRMVQIDSIESTAALYAARDSMAKLQNALASQKVATAKAQTKSQINFWWAVIATGIIAAAVVIRCVNPKLIS